MAEDYLKAQAEADLEQVCELTAEDTQKELLEANEADDCGEYDDKVKEQEDYDTIVDYLNDLKVDIEIGKVDEKDDSATVAYTEKIEYTGDDEEGFTEFSGEETEFTTKGKISLVKEDGDWKIESDESDTE